MQSRNLGSAACVEGAWTARKNSAEYETTSVSLMDALGPLTRCLIAPAWAAWERSPYLRHYRTLLRTQFDAPEVIRRQQWEKTALLVEHAYRTTRFYRKRFLAAGLEP